MRTGKICLFFFLLISEISAQGIGTWKIYSAMNNVNSIVPYQTSVWAATNGGAFKYTGSDSSFSTITKADGLNSQELTAIGVDNSGKIWFGSQDGYINILGTENNSLNKIVDIFNSDKTQKQINNIFIKGDTAFVSFDFGLSIISTTSLSFYDSFLKLGNFPSESKVISAYKTNLIYAITDYGVAIQKANAVNLSAPESWNTYEFSTNIPATSANRITSFNGQILLASSNGVLSFTNNKWQPYTLSGNEVKDIATSGNTLYAITSNALYQYSNNQLTKLYENSDLTFNSISVSSSQSIYISTDDGLIEFANSKVKVLKPNGPTSNSFVNLSTDLFGNLYVATGKDVYGVGFYKFDGKKWTIYNKSNYPQLPNNSYYNIYAAPDSAVYISNWGKGVTILKNNAFQFFTADNSPLVGISNNTQFVAIADCKTDSKGNLWIANSQTASKKYLSVYTTGHAWYHFNVLGITENLNLDKMVIDQYDTKWFTVTATGTLGLYYFNENKTYTTTTDDKQGYLGTGDGLLSTDISCLAVDKKGYLWIGTSLGVNVMPDPSKLTFSSTLGKALRNQNVTCIAVDPLDQKWIGTQNGVFVLSSDGINLVYSEPLNSKNSSIPGDNIKSIAFDSKNGIAYIGTDFGLGALQTSSIQPVESFSKLFVYPNPLILNSSKNISLTIDGLIKSSLIKIFSITGNLIREIESPGGRVAFWDGKDTKGNFVASGVYIIVAYDSEANNVATSKVAVIKN